MIPEAKKALELLSHAEQQLKDTDDDISLGNIESARGRIVRMRPVERVGDGLWQFTGAIPTDRSGAHAFAARVVPYNETMTHPYETSLIRWA